jgi:uncharacterized low-complexity protein
MFTPTRIAICLAVVLGTASGALAAPRHASHHDKPTVTHALRTAAYDSPNARCGRGSCSHDWQVPVSGD